MANEVQQPQELEVERGLTITQPEPAKTVTAPTGEQTVDTGHSLPHAAAGAPPLTVVDSSQIPVHVNTAASVGNHVDVPKPVPIAHKEDEK